MKVPFILQGGESVDDSGILKLYKERDEKALQEVKIKYGENCKAIAFNILKNRQDAEEVFSDVLLTSWDSVPSAEPASLGAYLYRITRNLALKRYRDSRRKKRAGDVVAQSLNEIEECLPSSFDVDTELQSRALSAVIDAFLSGLDIESRRVFVLRYFAGMKETEIYKKLGISYGKTKASLKKSREALAEKLKDEGY